MDNDKGALGKRSQVLGYNRDWSGGVGVEMLRFGQGRRCNGRLLVGWWGKARLTRCG